VGSFASSIREGLKKSDNYPIFFTFRRGKLSKITPFWDKIVKMSIFWRKNFKNLEI